MAQVAVGDTLSVEEPAGTGTYVQLAELVSVNTPEITVETVDTSHHGSNGFRTWAAGAADFSEISAEINFDPGSATDQLVRSIAASRAPRAWRIGLGSSLTVDFNALITDVSTNNPLNDKRTMSITLKVVDGGVTVS